MILSSISFKDKGEIPSKYTCEGEDISPPLSITGVPAEAKTLALIVDDPDAPNGDFVHWVVYNIPVSTSTIEEGKEPEGDLGETDFGRLGWGGPCPPNGTHRYYFKLYALDKRIKSNRKMTKKELEEEMEGHILSRAQIVGTYKREQK